MAVSVVSAAVCASCNDLATGGEVKVLCIGDSLTTGVGGGGVTYPGVLASLGKTQTINTGKSGYIPRHILYNFLINESENLTTEQLKEIPPVDYENRIHQPAINTLRRFFVNGQTVKVLQGAGYIAYRWDETLTIDASNTIKPNIVGKVSHKPFVNAGRWVEIGPASPPNALPAICVLWVGANGMEVGDVSNCVKTILASYLKQDSNRHFLILGLVNRQNHNSGQHDIEDWSRWIGQCNSCLETAYPSNYCDLQAWFTSSGKYSENGYNTRHWFPQATDEQVAEDEADQRAGIMPRSLRSVSAPTHFNGTGYECVGTLVYNVLKERRWLSQ